MLESKEKDKNSEIDFLRRHAAHCSGVTYSNFVEQPCKLCEKLQQLTIKK